MTFRPIFLAFLPVLVALACEDESSPPPENHEHEHGGGSSGSSSGGTTGARGGSGASSGAPRGGTGASSGAASGGAAGSATGGSPSDGGSPAGGEPGEAGAGGDAGTGGGAGAGPEEPPIINGCTSYEDRREPLATRTLSWDGAIGEAPERCLRVRTGQSVTWAGDFDLHPLELSPFAAGSLGSAGDTYTVTFGAPGAWGYVCLTHSEMNGGIWVTP